VNQQNAPREDRKMPGGSSLIAPHAAHRPSKPSLVVALINFDRKLDSLFGALRQLYAQSRLLGDANPVVYYRKRAYARSVQIRLAGSARLAAFGYPRKKAGCLPGGQPF
jgi:hypothetical protein